MRGRPDDGAEDFLIRHFICKTKKVLLEHELRSTGKFSIASLQHRATFNFHSISQNMKITLSPFELSHQPPPPSSFSFSPSSLSIHISFFSSPSTRSQQLRWFTH